MSVPLTSWIMTLPGQTPAQIDTYDIQLDKPEVVLSEDGVVAAGEASLLERLEGVVRLHLNEPLPGVKAVSFRFVAGAVAKYDDVEFNANLRGPERLFDRTIALWDADDPENPSRILGADYHEFRFALKIPGHMPPSLRYPRGQVQYMLVAAIEWEPTVCGFTVPFWSWSPVTTKREVPVRKVPGKLECIVRRLKELGVDEKRVSVLSDDAADGDNGGIPSTTGRTVWSPVPEVAVSIPTRHATTATIVPVMVDLFDGASLVSFRWTLRQQANFEYKYNIAVRGPIDSPNNAITTKNREERFVLKNAFTFRPDEHDDGAAADATHHPIYIPLVNAPDGAQRHDVQTELVEDLETTVMTVRHFAKLEVVYRLKDASSTDQDIEAEIELPIVLYIPPTHPTVSPIPAPIAVAAQAAGDESAQPPAYAEDTAQPPPPTYAGDETTDSAGVRRRRV
ncbi:hypothetical protein HDU87_001997 [Geranomyces variabilis]|uniref:Arrestin-like N-terminal domain-containing protein n=1 Tax=Geranomyces variabilis TaxID=109894 RepID=A0AAD5XRM9_9FUNG|nr:hypothetical protein HDU87_001997 [Geranomyces variabilis]